MDSVGGGGTSRNFPGSIFCGVTEFCPLTPVTDPQFVLFKHILCFARIMSSLCPNSCRQTARIGGGAAAPPPPSRTPMTGPQMFLLGYLFDSIQINITP